MAASAPTISQLSSSFSFSFNRNLQFHLRQRSIFFPPLPLSRSSKLSTVLRSSGGVEGLRGGEVSNSEVLISEADAMSSEPANEKAYGAAKIHDFCFGIPYGGLVLSGGFLGFLFTRNVTALSTGVLFGGALLALSFLSLKIWRQGKSSIPFVLGQAALSAALVWKNFQAYSVTKKLFPTGFYAVVSAAMLCFFSYVMISGGNPPPKKLQSSSGLS
ncbi:protein FATTY ACID EXPORT 1, chloroplastic [Mercurialis annua]|uniref:protein FATTY ACID EXPORT 1, chloroplastic n=1 Tax=Mercurialis annua TaxID=3986 RepID=UPI00215FD335|nr:protein FATTY ACID EXPORT 1, chloroplastic [Mercurialis annua]